MMHQVQVGEEPGACSTNDATMDCEASKTVASKNHPLETRTDENRQGSPATAINEQPTIDGHGEIKSDLGDKQQIPANSLDNENNNNNKTDAAVGDQSATSVAKPKFKEKRPVPLKLNKSSNNNNNNNNQSPSSAGQHQDTPLDLSTKTPGSCVLSNSSLYAIHQNYHQLLTRDGQTNPSTGSLSSLVSCGPLETPRIMWQDPYDMVLHKMRLYSASSGSSASQTHNPFATSRSGGGGGLHHSASSFNLATDQMATPLTPITPNTPQTRSSILLSAAGLAMPSPFGVDCATTTTTNNNNNNNHQQTISGKTGPLSATDFYNNSIVAAALDNKHQHTSSSELHQLSDGSINSPATRFPLNPLVGGGCLSSLGTAAQHLARQQQKTSPISSIINNQQQVHSNMLSTAYGGPEDKNNHTTLPWLSPNQGYNNGSVPRRSCSSDNLISLLNSPLFQHQMQALEMQEQLTPSLLNTTPLSAKSSQHLDGLLNKMINCSEWRNNNSQQSTIGSHLSPQMLSNLAAQSAAALNACHSATALNQRFLYPSCRDNYEAQQKQHQQQSQSTQSTACSTAAATNLLNNIHICSPTGSNNSDKTSPKNNTNDSSPMNQLAMQQHQRSANSSQRLRYARNVAASGGDLQAANNNNESPLSTHLSNTSSSLHTPKLLSPMFTNNLPGMPTPPSASAFDIWANEFRFPAVTNLGCDQLYHFSSSETLFSPLASSKLAPSTKVAQTTPINNNNRQQQQQTTAQLQPDCRQQPIESKCNEVDIDIDVNLVVVENNNNAKNNADKRLVEPTTKNNDLSVAADHQFNKNSTGNYGAGSQAGSHNCVMAANQPDYAQLITSVHDKTAGRRSASSEATSNGAPASPPVRPMDTDEHESNQGKETPTSARDNNNNNNCWRVDSRSSSTCDSRTERAATAIANGDLWGVRAGSQHARGCHDLPKRSASAIPRIYVSSAAAAAGGQFAQESVGKMRANSCQRQQQQHSTNLADDAMQANSISSGPSRSTLSAGRSAQVLSQQTTGQGATFGDCKQQQQQYSSTGYHGDEPHDRNQSSSAPPQFQETVGPRREVGGYQLATMDVEQQPAINVTTGSLENNNNNATAQQQTTTKYPFAPEFVAHTNAMSREQQQQQQCFSNCEPPSSASVSRCSSRQSVDCATSSVLSTRPLASGQFASTGQVGPLVASHVGLDAPTTASGFRSNSAEPLVGASFAATAGQQQQHHHQAGIRANGRGQVPNNAPNLAGSGPRSRSSCEVQRQQHQINQHQQQHERLTQLNPLSSSSSVAPFTVNSSQSVQHLPQAVNHQLHSNNPNSNPTHNQHHINSLHQGHQQHSFAAGSMAPVRQSQFEPATTGQHQSRSQPHLRLYASSQEQIKRPLVQAQQQQTSDAYYASLTQDNVSSSQQQANAACNWTSQGYATQQQEQLGGGISHQQRQHELVNQRQSENNCSSAFNQVAAPSDAGAFSMEQQQQQINGCIYKPISNQALTNENLELNSQFRASTGLRNCNQQATVNSAAVARSLSADRWPSSQQYYAQQQHQAQHPIVQLACLQPAAYQQRATNQHHAPASIKQTASLVQLNQASIVDQHSSDSTHATSMSSFGDASSPYASQLTSTTNQLSHQQVKIEQQQTTNVISADLRLMAQFNHQHHIGMKPRRPISRDRSHHHQHTSGAFHHKPLTSGASFKRSASSAAGCGTVGESGPGRGPNHLQHHGRRYHCDSCQKSFTRSDMLTRHRRLHSGDKPFGCAHCNQTFSRSDHLQTHMRTHTGQKPYKCNVCKYTACRKDMITRHMRTHNRTGA